MCVDFQFPRVRYAACNAIGQMCTDFAPTMQKEFHQKIIVALCNVLDDNAHPKVQVSGIDRKCHGCRDGLTVPERLSQIPIVTS